MNINNMLFTAIAIKQQFIRFVTRMLGGGRRGFVITVGLLAAIIATAAPASHADGRPTGEANAAQNSVLATAHIQRETPAASVKTLSLILPLRNEDALDALIQHLYTPGDPLYGKYLTPQQFTAEFGPTQQQVDDVEQAAQGHGLSTVDVSPNHLMVKVSGRVDAINAAFGVTLHDYVASDGRPFVSDAGKRTIPADLNGKIHTVFGLDGSPVMRRMDRPDAALDKSLRLLEPMTAGGYSGPDGMVPIDIWSVYDWGAPTEGVGQSVGLFEMAGWTPSDITVYETRYIGNMLTPQLIPVDGGTNTQTDDGSQEVTLDVDMLLAMAPQLANIYIYDAPRYEDQMTATYDIFTQMASDKKASVISNSWGMHEDIISQTDANSLYAVFKQLASQGQTVVSSAGDAGAFQDPDSGTPTVSIPQDIPYGLSVGGTELTDDANLAYVSESSWNTFPACYADVSNCTFDPGAGGGGISSDFSIPQYQIGAFTAAGNPQGSLTMRNTPDVSLYADFYGYDIVYTPSTGPTAGIQADESIGGTSASAPLWAGFLASVNEDRGYNGLPNVGFVNPMIYAIAESPQYSSDFHDINDGSNNDGEGYITPPYQTTYTAVTGYDNSTGWGSFQAEHLWEDLSTYAGPTITRISATPSTVTGKTTTLAVTASDPYTSSLTYAWTQASGPASSTIASPTASSTSVTFARAGSYVFSVTVTNRFGVPVTSTVGVTVNQTPTTQTVTPTSVTLSTGSTQQFTDAIADQFGNAYSATTTWSVTGVGSISSSGLYTAGATTGAATVKAVAAGLTKTATVTVTGSAPPAPTGLTATGGNAQVTLSWSASAGAASYSVYRGTGSNGESATAIATGITATVYTNTGLTNGTKYYYKAAAVNTSGTSPQSGEANATPQATSFSGTWQLTPQSATALRLNVSGNGTANGTLLTVSTSNGTTAQSFAFNNSGVVPAGDYNFSKVGGSYCVQDAGTTSGSKVEIWACGGTAAQSWAISNASTSGFYLLKPSNASTMCLNATGTASGSSVTIATCSGATSQSWSGL